jgi:hypothetical protein
MIVVGLYIYIDGVAQRIELFNDEKISVTSSVQDIADISKVFTDYSQSFTIPASTKNNAIFAHWYENSVANGYDARLRADGYIELDTIPFRKGKIQLEKANLLKGQVDNYTITFFGSLISLKDAFGGKLLKELDFSSIPFVYSGANVQSAITGNVNGNVKFPLISSNNVWQYNTNGNTRLNWDITKTNHPIFTSELYPALRVNKIFDVIAAELGITFEGDFLTDQRFTRLFLWLKNAETSFILQSAPTKIDFGSKSATPSFLTSNFDIVNDQFYFDGGLIYDNDGVPYEFSRRSIIAQMTLTFATNGVPFVFSVYFENVKVADFTGTSSTAGVLIFIPLTSGVGYYSFYFSSNASISFNAEFSYTISGDTPVGPLTNQILANTTAAQTNSTNLDLANYMPDIKAEDFFSGILKMFNLTCYSEQAGVFKIEQLENWYNDGILRDVTEYIITDDTSIDRVTTYKQINFNYEKSESILNQNYKTRSVLEYGDLEYKLDIDGGEYAVKLPFENLLFNKFTGTNLQVGYALKPDFAVYKPKPILLYDYGVIQSVSFYLNNGSTNPTVTSYNMFGQDTLIATENFTINWGVEQSSFTNQLEGRTLFNQYYENYISNLFNFRARKLKLKAIMPISLITNLKLNDRLIIRDKRYLINSFTTDLTTGVVDLDLLTDFRTI